MLKLLYMFRILEFLPSFFININLFTNRKKIMLHQRMLRGDVKNDDKKKFSFFLARTLGSMVRGDAP